MMMSFEISPDTRALADKLKSVPHGGSISTDDLSKTIGRDIRSCRHLLYSAMKLARNEVGAIFGTVRGEGYQRLTTDQLPSIGATARAGIRRSAKRASRNIAAGMAKANDLPPDVQKQANKEISVLGLIEMSARDNSVKPTDDMQSAPMPVAKTTAEFLKNIGAEK